MIAFDIRSSREYAPQRHDAIGLIVYLDRRFSDFLLGCKSLGCSATLGRRGRDDRGGEQTWGPEHKEMAAVSKKRSVKKLFRRGDAGKPTSIVYGARPMTVEEETGMCTPWNRRDSGP